MVKRKYLKQIKQNKNRNKVKIISKMVLISIFIFGLIIHLCVQPSLKNAVMYESKIIAINAISDAVYKELSRTDIKYEDIVNLKTDEKGSIIAIETDMNTVNKLKATLTTEVTKSLREMEAYPYNISLGTLLGTEYLAGRGPNLNLKIEPTGFLEADLLSNFSSAGINQTHHKIILNITVDITTYIPLSRNSTKVSTNFILAETVIVGDVPQYYSSVISDDTKLLPNYNKYNLNNYPKLENNN